MKLIVEQCQRYAKMRAHTATHLLHTELAKIFATTKQAGSLVDEDYLRFDFNADRLLSVEEIHEIEKNINQIIYDAYAVEVKETSYPDAIALGAKAFFEDKYGDIVRVVRIFDHTNAIVSIELCGGTHVINTKDIGCFAIIGQEAVASGVKRITAVVGPKVAMRNYELQTILDTTVEKLGIKTHTQLADKLDKTLKEYDEMKKTLEMLQAQIIKQALQLRNASSDTHFEKIIKLPSDLNFKSVSYYAKGLFTDTNILIYNEEGSFLIFTKQGTSAKQIVEELGIKGGGNDTMIQGKDEKILEIIK